MATRTVVSIFSDIHEQVSFNLSSAPGSIENAETLYSFGCTAAEPVFASVNQQPLSCDAMQFAGKRLFEELAIHPAVKTAMTVALTIPQESMAPLYIYLQATNDKIEELPWESLYEASSGAFLALDSRWPVARIVNGSALMNIERTFLPPLKVVAVLSAAAVDATPEWRDFYDAIKEADDLELSVFVCQPELKAEIEQLGDHRVSVQYIATKPDLFAALTTLDPHMLHFFCHGSTDGGPHLQLATRADWTGENPRGSIALGKDELAPFGKPQRNIWLVTLNCCQGAAAQDTYSLARSLVEQGFPAVVGMREVIATEDAHLFCKAFYASALSIVRAVGQPGKAGEPSIVEWANALYQPRIQLCDRYNSAVPLMQAAASLKEWTLPVMYVRPELFELRISPTKKSHQMDVDEITLKALQGFLATHPDTPPEKLVAIKQTIDILWQQLSAGPSPSGNVAVVA